MPVRVIQPLMNVWYDQQDKLVSTHYGGGVRDASPFVALSERSGIKQDTIEKTFYGRNQTVEFNVADKLVIAMTGMPMIDHFADYPELKKWYYKVDLTKRTRTKDEKLRCERKGCSNSFLANRKGGTVRRFCSHACAMANRRKERGDTVKTTGGPKDKLRKFRCKNGHTRTSDNTTRDINGKVVCLECKRAATKRYAEAKAKRQNQKSARATGKKLAAA